MKINTDLYHATVKPDLSIENQWRSIRVWDLLDQAGKPLLYKDIRRELGLSWRQTVRAVGLLVSVKAAKVQVDVVWNGQHYIHPHKVIAL